MTVQFTFELVQLQLHISRFLRQHRLPLLPQTRKLPPRPRKQRESLELERCSIFKEQHPTSQLDLPRPKFSLCSETQRPRRARRCSTSAQQSTSNTAWSPAGKSIPHLPSESNFGPTLQSHPV